MVKWDLKIKRYMDGLVILTVKRDLYD